MPTLEYFYSHGRTHLWTAYGFLDAFNLSAQWYDTDELGIDQGPIVIMIENYRNQNVWRLFMQNAEIQRGLQQAGFVSLPFMALTAQAQPAQKHRHFDLGGHFKPDLSSGILDQPDLLVYLADRGSDRHEYHRQLDR